MFLAARAALRGTRVCDSEFVHQFNCYCLYDYLQKCEKCSVQRDTIFTRDLVVCPLGMRTTAARHNLSWPIINSPTTLSSHRCLSVSVLGTVHYLQRGWHRREMGWVKEIFRHEKVG